MSRPVEFSHRTRAQNLRELAERRFDLLVIGGGITGVGVARDAALRGLSVALLERRDFASGTSSRSSKLIHGGLRYLQQADVGLVREAATERYAVRKLAPHLARPVQMLFPIYSRASYAKMSAALWTYDKLASVSDEERHRMLGREETLALEPRLQADHLYAGGLYYEYLTDDARLVIEVGKAAAALGACLATYCEVEQFLFDDGRSVGVVARDQLSGETLEVRGTAIVNAAGPWVDAVRLLSETGDKPRLRLTKGIHLGVRTERIGLSHIVVMNARDKRGVFAIPRGAVTYLGTTDTFYDKPEDYPYVTLEDVEYLLDAANRTFAVEPALTADDVVNAWAGLRPLLAQEGKSPSELSRKDEVMVAANGLISVAGGKLTTFRRMAERVVDLACERLQQAGVTLPARKGASDAVPLGSADTGDDVDAYARGLAARWPTVGADVVERLVTLYGSHAERMIDAIGADPQLGERLDPQRAVTRAEIEYAVREEMALTLEDVLERRCRLLLWDTELGASVAEGAARILAARLGWDEARRRDEVAHYLALVERLQRFEPESADDAARAAHG
ncbi:MAG: glycerol-3-phosphate dehydrogenase/oxidase [Deltaproteobacteria bacterium]|nr:glycerol-3-phosphate dehydrogenase/oxidase [Deltaproteobacteria bacterium]